jgi:hypothetical protein
VPEVYVVDVRCTCPWEHHNPSASLLGTLRKYLQLIFDLGTVQISEPATIQ